MMPWRAGVTDSRRDVKLTCRKETHHDHTACNDTDSCPTLRTRVRGIYLAAPLDAQAWPKVQTGLSSGLQSHLVGALHRDAVEVPACANRPPWETGHSLHDYLQSLCQMGG